MITRATLSTIEQGLPKYRSMLAGNEAYSPTAFDSIATVTASGGETSLSFSSIPATYRYLQIRGIARDSESRANGSCYPIGIRFNADTGYNYTIHEIRGTGSGVSSSGYPANSSSGYPYMQIGVMMGTNSGGNFGVSIIDIHDYASTSKNKTVRGFSGGDNALAGGSGSGVFLQSGAWLSLNAISTITIAPLTTGGTWLANTSFALYGIRGS